MISHHFMWAVISAAQQAADKPQGAQGWLVQMAPLALMFVAIYFLLIRPMGKRRKEQQQLVTSLKKGDEVITNSGILGRVQSVEDQFIMLEIADRVRVRILKSQIAGRYNPQGNNEQAAT